MKEEDNGDENSNVDKIVVVGDLINKIGQGTRNLNHLRILKTMSERNNKKARNVLSKSNLG
jgi:hypothetical protein